MARVKHPSFKRPNSNILKRVKVGWRKPRGIDSKQKMHLAWAGAHPDVGYRGPKDQRDRHGSGAPVARVCNARELDAVPKGTLVRLAATLGEKSRKAMREKAAAKGLTVVN
jgi:large subunit ribosomal protein L32e